MKKWGLMPKDKTILADNIKFDEGNARHRTVSGQPAALKALIKSQSRSGTNGLINLSKHIVEHKTLSPIDRIAVVQEKASGKYIAAEGNRRLACVKMLLNPNFALGTEVETYFNKASKELTAKTRNKLSRIKAVVFDDRASADTWVDLKHRSGSAGAGTVAWNTFSSARAASSKDMAFLDKLSNSKGASNLKSLVDDYSFNAYSTFVRVIPALREFFKIHVNDDGTIITQDKTGPTKTQVLSDAAKIAFYIGSKAQGWDVRSLNTKNDILTKLAKEFPNYTAAKIFAAQQSPPSQTGQGNSSTPSASPSGASNNSGTNSPQPTPSSGAAASSGNARPNRNKLHIHLVSVIKDDHIDGLLHEVSVMPITKYPASSAALLRMLYEAVMRHHCTKVTGRRMSAEDFVNWHISKKTYGPNLTKILQHYKNNELVKLDGVVHGSTKANALSVKAVADHMSPWLKYALKMP